MSTMEYIDIQCPTAAEMFGLMPKGSSRPLRFEILGYAELEDGQHFPILGKIVPINKAIPVKLGKTDK